MATTALDRLFETLYERVRTREWSLDAANIVRIVSDLMVLVESFSNEQTHKIPGLTKKDLVLRLTRRLIEDSTLDGETKTTLILLCAPVFANMVDLFCERGLQVIKKKCPFSFFCCRSVQG